MSVNEAWRGGRRYRTKEYLAYEEALMYLLPCAKIPKGRLAIKFVFGLSNVRNDIDNSIKPFVDILQKRYDFNDNRIYKLDVKKEIVKKGDEFVDFDIKGLD